jgi:hypothetical protein
MHNFVIIVSSIWHTIGKHKKYINYKFKFCQIIKFEKWLNDKIASFGQH